LCKGGTKSFITFQKHRTAHLLFNWNKKFELEIDDTVLMKNIFENSSNTDLAFMKYAFQINNDEILVFIYSKKTGHRFAKFLFK